MVTPSLILIATSLSVVTPYVALLAVQWSGATSGALAGPASVDPAAAWATSGRPPSVTAAATAATRVRRAVRRGRPAGVRRRIGTRSVREVFVSVSTELQRIPPSGRTRGPTACPPRRSGGRPIWCCLL